MAKPYFHVTNSAGTNKSILANSLTPLTHNTYRLGGDDFHAEIIFVQVVISICADTFENLYLHFI